MATQSFTVTGTLYQLPAILFGADGKAFFTGPTMDQVAAASQPVAPTIDAPPAKRRRVEDLPSASWISLAQFKAIENVDEALIRSFLLPSANELVAALSTVTLLLSKPAVALKSIRRWARDWFEKPRPEGCALILLALFQGLIKGRHLSELVCTEFQQRVIDLPAHSPDVPLMLLALSTAWATLSHKRPKGALVPVSAEVKRERATSGFGKLFIVGEDFSTFAINALRALPHAETDLAAWKVGEARSRAKAAQVIGIYAWNNNVCRNGTITVDSVLADLLKMEVGSSFPVSGVQSYIKRCMLENAPLTATVDDWKPSDECMRKIAQMRKAVQRSGIPSASPTEPAKASVVALAPPVTEAADDEGYSSAEDDKK